MIWSPGKTLKNGLYTIDEVLRHGRLSVTYLATSMKGDRVVIKAMNDAAITPADLAKLRGRFNDEATTLIRCESRHIVKVENLFEEEGLICIPMEFVSGMTLDKRNPLKLPEAEALRYIRQIGEALEVLERRNFLHRDITPHNIMLRSNAGVNEAVLIDFGLVRDLDIKVSTLLASDVTAFTAPELCDSGEERGHYTSLYALGAVLFALITGTNPPQAVKRKANEKLPFPAGTHPEIAAAIEEAMQLDSRNRPPLTEWLKTLPDIEVSQPMQPIVLPSETPEARKKRMEDQQIEFLKWGTIAAVVAAIATVLATAIAYKSSQEAPKPVESPPIVQPAKAK